MKEIIWMNERDYLNEWKWHSLSLVSCDSSRRSKTCNFWSWRGYLCSAAGRLNDFIKRFRVRGQWGVSVGLKAPYTGLKAFVAGLFRRLEWGVVVNRFLVEKRRVAYVETTICSKSFLFILYCPCIFVSFQSSIGAKPQRRCWYDFWGNIWIS